jgi:hypothetical protein
VELAGLKRPVLTERQPEPTSHLHFSKAHPVPVSRTVMNQDGKHAAG